jgi:small subunit ribosomal protein S2
MNLPKITIQELLEAGVHYGHKTMRWNPKMAPYIYGTHNDIHIMDLQQTLPMLYSALSAIYNTVKNNGRVLFVGTKIQAGPIVAEEAKRCGQYYVNHRWLGGMLTNFSTVAASIKRLEMLENKMRLAEEDATMAADATNAEVGEGGEGTVVSKRARFTKKELLEIERKADKIERSLGGIRSMGGRPDILFVIDTNKESLALKEAERLGIPVVAIVDSNSNPDGIDYLVPGNDDATRAIRIFCKLVADAVLAGIQDSMVASGVDMGANQAAGGASGLHKDGVDPTKTKKASKAVGTHNKKAVVARAPAAGKATASNEEDADFSAASESQAS